MRIFVKTNFNTILSSLTDTIESLQIGKGNYDGLVRTVATTSLAQIRRRIHEEGKAADGNDIGQYNTTKPLYVNPNNSPKGFVPAGKRQIVFNVNSKKQTQIRSTTTVYDIATRLSKKVDIKSDFSERKTRYFDSYDTFKTFIGRNQLKKVNLFLSGTLANQFVVIDTANGYGLGWPNAEKYDIAKGMEKKYGKKIYELTDEEKKLATEVAANYLFDVFNK